MLMNTPEYISIIENIKSEIRAAQYRAAVHVNADMLLLYHDIGCVINEHKAWGNKFVDNLATDIRIAFPESKGYSVRITFLSTRLKVDYISARFWRIRSRTLNAGCHLRRVSLLRRPSKTRMSLILFRSEKICWSGTLSRH